MTATPRPLIWLLLLTIIAGATYLRGVGLDWDEQSRLHPDERFLSMVAHALAPVGSLREYLDTEGSSLNPNNRGYAFYVYGNLPINVVHYVGRWFARPDNDLDQRLFGRELGSEYHSVHLVGRGVSAVCDVLTTLLVFAIGAQLYGPVVGLLGAALYGGAVLPIQQAHFFTVDAMANLFVVLAFWLAVRASTRARWTDDVLFGLALGAGLACKLSIFPIALLLVLGIVVRLSVQRAVLRSEAVEDDARGRRRGGALFIRAALSLNLVFLVSVLAFRLLQPYAFEPFFAAIPDIGADAGTRFIRRVVDVVAADINPKWREQMSKLQALQTGADDSPPNHQWAMRAPLVFPWLNLVRFGLGWPLGLVAWIGFCAALVEGVRGRSESWRHVLPVAWVGVFFAWYGAGWVLSMRYLLPIYPVLALLAAWLLIRIAAPELDASVAGSPAPPRWRRVVGIAAIAAVVASTYAYAFAFTRIYTRPHTRIAASRWIYEHIPADVTLAIETATGPVLRQVGLPNRWQPAEISNDEAAQPTSAFTYLDPGQPLAEPFTLAQSGQLIAVRLNDIRSPPGVETRLLTIDLLDDAGDALATCGFEGPFASDGNATVPLECPIKSVMLEADRKYWLRVRAIGGPLISAGATIANEGHWDDPVPVPLPHFDPWQAAYQIYGLEMVMEDDPTKRRRMQHILDRADYVVISSNRFYGSLPRNPRRWPMTIDYYRALFSGELGFEMIGDFSAYPTLGPWWVDDQRAEEVFTVYDHPRVLVFRKTAAYDPARTATILSRAPLTRVERKPAIEVIDPPQHVEPPRWEKRN